jgi:hypothetical protein
MIFIRVRYDVYDRQFKLLDRELAGMLEDGETYLLAVDSSTVESGTEDFIEVRDSDLAHA